MKKAIFLLLLTATLNLFSQEETVEDLYLRVPPETRIIDSQAQSPSRELKTKAIDGLIVMNEEGRLNGNDPFVMKIVTNLGMEGTGIISLNQGLPVNNFPEVRRKAAKLLGEINTVQAAEALIELGEMEYESSVLSEIIYGISKNTAADPEDVVNTVARLMEVNGRSRDHNFAFAFLQAVENMVENGIEITNPGIYEQVSLLTLPESGYLNKVAEKAEQVLEGMK